MIRLLFSYIAFFAAVYLVVSLLRSWHSSRKKSPDIGKSKHGGLRGKYPQEMWVQVYDTDSVDEAKSFVARLEEEELDCFLYEQGRKDVHGNLLKGFGIAVPRSQTSRAQNIISRISV